MMKSIVPLVVVVAKGVRDTCDVGKSGPFRTKVIVIVFFLLILLNAKASKTQQRKC